MALKKTMDSKGLKAEGVPKSIIIDKMDYDYLSKLPTEIQQNIIRVLPINDIIALDVYYHFFVLVMVRYAAIYYAIYYEVCCRAHLFHSVSGGGVQFSILLNSASFDLWQ